MSPVRIFVTHSSHDAVTATKIRDYLESNDIQCWMAPRDIPIGEEWAKGILNGINTASGMLLVFSSNSNDSSQVRREIERAIHNNIPIYPVRIEDVQPSDAMEYYISSNHWMDAFGGNFETNLDKLVSAIKSKHNITQESKPEPTSMPVQSKEQSPTPISQVTDKSSKRKLIFPRFSFKMPKKILFLIAFLLLLLAGYFISKSFENSNLDAITTEVIAPLPLDTINTFVRMIASTDEFGDYVSDIKVTEDGNYVIMGYSYVNDDYEGKPWIAMFDSLGNEMWKHEGSILGGQGEFDIYPDGRSVWAYPMVDTTLVNNRGYTRFFVEYLSSSGEVIGYPWNIILDNSYGWFGYSTNMYSRTRGLVKDVQLEEDFVCVFTQSAIVAPWQSAYSEDYPGQSTYVFGSVENGTFEEFENWNNFKHESYFTCWEIDEVGLISRSFREGRVQFDSFGASSIEILGGTIYTASINDESIHFESLMDSLNSDTNQHLTRERRVQSYNILEERVVDNYSEIFLSTNSYEFLISLFQDGKVYCLKLDRDGNEIWLKSFNCASNNDEIYGATFINDAYFIFGQSFSFESGDFDGYLLKIDENGDIVWEQKFDFGGYEDLWGVEGTSDGGLILVLESEVNGTSDVFLMKADSLGNVPEFNSSDNRILLHEDWTSSETLLENWLDWAHDFWRISEHSAFDNLLCLTILGRLGINKTPFGGNENFSLFAQMGAVGYADIDTRINYLRMGALKDRNTDFGPGYYVAGSSISYFPVAPGLVSNAVFPALFSSVVNDTTGGFEDFFMPEKVWFHWDFDSNESFDGCGRIGVGYFNGDSIVIGKVEPDTSWVEYGVLNDFEIKIDGNSADYFINDSLFFHTDDFVCESDSLYLYLGGASGTIPNAIGEVRVTSE